jgi:hypothetical protein
MAIVDCHHDAVTNDAFSQQQAERNPEKLVRNRNPEKLSKYDGCTRYEVHSRGRLWLWSIESTVEGEGDCDSRGIGGNSKVASRLQMQITLRFVKSLMVKKYCVAAPP